MTKRLAAIPGWPYSPAAVLAMAGVGEALVRSGADGLTLASTIVLAIASTAPVAWVAAHWLAPATITLAAAVSLLYDGRLTNAGLVSVTLTFYALARMRPAWQVVVLAIPLVLVGVGYLIADSGPAADDLTLDEVIISGEPPRAPDPPDPPAPPQVLDAPSDGVTMLPVLVAVLGVGGAAVGLVQRTRTTEERLVESEASVADVTLAHSAQGERVRIARELHDVVAHRITSIAVQAETTRLTTPGLSDEGAQRLTEIADSARDALDEMRRLLGVLRKDAAEAAERAPQPRVADLNELIREARALSDASVRLTFSGHVAPLDPALELTAYRIVQEALTNARRHSPGAAVDVELGYGDSELCVEIRDTGGSADTDVKPGGHGVLGMRERVAMAGGRLSVGRSSSGGFIVTATLPRSERVEAHG